MAIKLENKTRVVAPSSDYPFGKIKDTTVSAPGTPVSESVYGDFHQFFAKMLDNSGVVANGLPDNDYSGFQYFQSLLKVVAKYTVGPLVRGIVKAYVDDDLIVIYGVDITLSNSNNTATWTAGAIFYNDVIYLVESGSATKGGGQSFVYGISDEDDNLISISYGASGSGIADYGSSTVRALNNKSKVVITGWNMAGTDTITLNHGLTDFQRRNLKNIFIYIFDDAGTNSYMLNGSTNTLAGGGVQELTATQILISRISSGMFDNTNFNNPLVTRGYIIFEWSHY